MQSTAVAQPLPLVPHSPISSMNEATALCLSATADAGVRRFLREVSECEGDPCFWTAMGELHRNQLGEQK